MFTEPRLWSAPRHIPGRLYFDESAVPVRSSFERQLLQLLRAAEVEPCKAGGAGSARNFLIEVVDFVESAEYTTLAEEMDRIGAPA
jgi:hypothetical protein